MTTETACVIIRLALRGNTFSTVGVYNIEVPPVPIPNTVVKLNRAENTWREAARENRSSPTQTKPPIRVVFSLRKSVPITRKRLRRNAATVFDSSIAEHAQRAFGGTYNLFLLYGNAVSCKAKKHSVPRRENRLLILRGSYAFTLRKKSPIL